MAMAEAPGKVAVVDANGLLEGALEARRGAHEVITTPPAEAEVHDPRGREQVAALKRALAPFGGLQHQHPPEDAARAVWHFARRTGDASVLSNTDLGLIALARTLHLSKHGDSTLRSWPPPTRARGADQRKLAPIPGWDYVPNSESWPPDNSGTGFVQNDSDCTAAVASLDDCERSDSEDVRMRKQSRYDAHKDGQSTTADVSAPGNDEHEGFIVKVGRRAASKRRKEKQAQKVAQQQEYKDNVGSAEQSDDDSHESMNQRRTQDDEASVKAIACAPPATELQQRFVQPPSTGERQLEHGSKTSSKQPDGAREDNAAMNDAEGLDGNVTTKDKDFEAVQDPDVWLVTGDFAMQNVAVQMGLGVAPPSSGRLLREARRYTRRCHACGKEARDDSRHFCEQCGNATLVRCAVRANAGWKEYELHAAPRMKLNGTRYSLPKPTGGREQSSVPVLREDELPKRWRRKDKAKADAAPPDPFKPEFPHDLFRREGKPRQQGPDPRSRPLVGREGNPNKPRRPRTER
jgi:RNA-binding protein NOB1